MNDTSLTEIVRDLQDFQTVIAELKTNNPEWYDANLKIPKWQKSNSEDFANDVLGNIGKFSTHASMLQNDSDLIPDENINKSTLTDLSQKLAENIELYIKVNPKQQSRYQQLLENLKNMNKILQKIVMQRNNQNKPKL